MTEKLDARPATPADFEGFELSPEDKYEEALACTSFKDSALKNLEAGHEVWTIVDLEDKPLAFFGYVWVGRLMVPWMVSSVGLAEHAREFLRKARIICDAMRHSPADSVGNFIAKGVPRHRAFVERMGFTIIPAPCGPYDYFTYV